VSHDVYACSNIEPIYKPPRVEGRAGTSISPMWAGTNATNVPKEAAVIENDDTNIRLSDVSL